MLQSCDIAAAAWYAPLLPDTDSNTDDSTESVVDSIDSDDKVHDVYYDAHELKDNHTGSPDVANPEVPWPYGIG